MVRQYGINSNKFLEYIQLKSIIRAKYSRLELKLHPTIEKFLKICPPKALSKSYGLFASHDKTTSIPTAKWEMDLSFNRNQDFWRQICLNIFRITSHPNLQLIQFKTLHRTHYTGQRMFQMGLSDSNICVHCSDNSIDNYMHAMWACAPVNNFWWKVCEDLERYLGCSVPASPSLCILGDVSDTNIEPNKTGLLLTALSIAKKTILMNWKSKKNLSIPQYKNLLLDHIAMERMSALSKNRLADFLRSWEPLINSLT